MDFKEFEYILMIEKKRNITKAAQELFVAQPFLSYYIRKVEEDLGVALFDRSTNPLTLTLAGEKYVEMASDIKYRFQMFKEDIDKIKSRKKGKIILGIPQARAAYMLPYVLPEFSLKFPDIEVKTVEEKTSILKDYLRKKLVDCIIIPTGSAIDLDDKEFKYDSIYKEELFLISSTKINEEEYVMGESFISTEQLGNHSFVLLRSGHGIRYAVDSLFNSEKIKPKIILETTSNETAFRLASSGMGVAIVPEISVFSFRSVANPYIYRLTKTGKTWDVLLMRNQNTDSDEFLQLFLGIIKEKFSDDNRSKLL